MTACVIPEEALEKNASLDEDWGNSWCHGSKVTHKRDRRFMTSERGGNASPSLSAFCLIVSYISYKGNDKEIYKRQPWTLKIRIPPHAHFMVIADGLFQSDELWEYTPTLLQNLSAQSAKDSCCLPPLSVISVATE